jgi:hypothetical protein
MRLKRTWHVDGVAGARGGITNTGHGDGVVIRVQRLLREVHRTEDVVDLNPSPSGFSSGSPHTGRKDLCRWVFDSAAAGALVSCSGSPAAAHRLEPVRGGG